MCGSAAPRDRSGQRRLPPLEARPTCCRRRRWYSALCGRPWERARPSADKTSGATTRQPGLLGCPHRVGSAGSSHHHFPTEVRGPRQASVFSVCCPLVSASTPVCPSRYFLHRRSCWWTRKPVALSPPRCAGLGHDDWGARSVLPDCFRSWRTMRTSSVKLTLS